MITVLIAKDEVKIKEMLAKLLKQKGFVITDEWEKDNVIKIISQDSVKQVFAWQDKIVELEDALYKEKEGVLYRYIIENVEKPLFEQVLQKTEGNQLKAARILGINRNTMRSKVKKLGINANKYRS